MSSDTIARSFLSTSETGTSATDAFRNALCAAKEAKRLTTKQVARLLRRTPKGAERLLSGENAPSFDTLIAACREFDECWLVVQAAVGREGSASIADAANTLSMLADELRRRA